MRQDDHSTCDLLLELMQLFVSFLDLFVQRLIFNLQLFEIDQVETVGKLLFLFQNLFFVRQLVSQSDILKSVLMHFLIFEGFALFPLVEGLFGDFLASPGEDRVLCDTSLQFFELLFDLVALRLLLVKLMLELGSHFVVSVLGLFQVDSNLMNIREGVEVLVLVHLHVWCFVVLVKV